MIKLGDTVKDRISGFTGIAVGRSEYLYANPRIQVQPEAMDGCLPVAEQWMDEGRLETTATDRAVGFHL